MRTGADGRRDPIVAVYTNLWRAGIPFGRGDSGDRALQGAGYLAVPAWRTAYVRVRRPRPPVLPVLTSTGRDDPPLRAPPMHDRRDQSRPRAGHLGQDRKSTRLNSSHGYISYAVFCLK